MNELALFAGAGGGILGGKLLGWRTVCAVELNAYAASILAQRQNDGLLPAFPVWDDVCTFDGHPWRGIVDVVSGGFPCQDISAAGRGAGIHGERSGLWSEFARIIREVGPRYVFVENSPILTSRGIDVVLGDLAALGYDAEWGVLSAAEVGAPHKRDRIWIVAYASGGRRQKDKLRAGRDKLGICSEELADPKKFPERARFRKSEKTEKRWRRPSNGGCQDLADTMRPGRKELNSSSVAKKPRFAPWIFTEAGRETWWSTEPDVGRVAHGVAARVDRLTAIGNGQVPVCAAEAFMLLLERVGC